MKGRSHRLPPSAPLEDWGDGQWTVDCSCGVTFDDGEEMVSCDECGVWVHTRCSRYVRGEASFACHNCKAATKRPRSAAASVADTEETEVAQLLVELPTKTDRCPPPIPYRPPFRLWAHVPMEEKVHVQGVPGGDPSLFRGLSSTILSPELWKCTGYVPKKFNFKYKEFPCWEEEERDKASRGADVLFSLSKETVQAAPVRAFDRLLSSPDGSKKKKVGEKAFFGSRPFGCVKKERNKLRVMGSHSSKGRKEGSVEEKEFSGKKKAGGDLARAFTRIKERAVSAPFRDSRKEDLCEDVGLQIAESDMPDAKSVYKREEVLLKASTKNLEEGMENGSKPKHTLVFKTSKRGLSDEALRSKLSLETLVKVEKVDRMDARVSCTLNTVAGCSVEESNTSKDLVGHEDVAKLIHGFRVPKDESCVDSLNGGSSDAAIQSEKIKADINSQDNQLYMPDITLVPSSASSCLSTKKVEINVKIEGTDAQALENSDIPSRLIADGKLSGMDDLSKHQQKSKDNSSIILEEAKTDRNLQSEEQKPQVLQKDSELSQSYQECINTAGIEPILHEQIVESVGPLTRWKGSFETNHVPKFYSTSPVKLNDANLNHSIPIQKVASIEKEFSASAAPAVSKSSVSSNQNSTANAISSSLAGKGHVKQQRVKLNTCNTGNRVTMTSIFSEESEQEIPPQPSKGHSTGSKSLKAGRISHSSASKNCSLDTKELLSGSSSQISDENPVTSLRAAEVTASLDQTSTNPSGLSQRNDKAIQPSTQPASKLLSHSLVMQASVSTNVTTALSDEELALLLHQELNSSPRVPRVPRMRQATSMQFTTPSASSMLSKRSYSGGRDQVSVFRRKHKEDASKESGRNSRDAIDESRRMGRHSPEPKRHESAVLSDGFARKGKRSRSPDITASSKANVPGTSIGGANSFTASFEENGARTSARSSLANVDGDGTIVARSLPGLIDEIMSKGKCSTYEELCDAVRPYWHSLRKPNGERYAYSSHSQAVLDCLRNRSEWAHLIDRGPKTNASKRRRKLDSETAAMELEHEDVKSRGSRELGDKSSGNSHTEEFPKRKRNVRKRRLLERRGGGMKESTNTRSSQGTFSDDDAAALSHSSNEEAECHVNLSDDAGADSSTSSSSDSD